MSVRELIVLGTASQVPTRYRNHNGYFLRWDADGMLFDPGEGTQRQMTTAGLAASQIHHVFITHFHGDHALGLAGIIQRISLDNVSHAVNIYYPASGQVYFDRLRYATIYMDKANIRPCPIRQSGVILEEKQYTVEAQRLDHGVEAFGYALRERDDHRMLPDRLAELDIKGPDIGRLHREGSLQIGDRLVRREEVSEPKPGQRFAFIMDTRPCPGAARLAERADLVVCESTYLDTERKDAHDHHHMTAKQAAELAAAAGARRLVLGHFSQRYPDLRAFHDEAAPIFPDVHVAADFDTIPVPQRSR